MFTMNITASALSLDSQHALSTRNQVREDLHFNQGGNRNPTETSIQGRGAVRIDISAEARARLSTAELSASSTTAAPATGTSEIDDASGATEPRMLVLARMIEALTGLRVRIVSAADLTGESAPTSPELPPQQRDNGPRTGWSLTYDRITVHTESETLQFSAQGVVQTADRRTIAFQTALHMQRSSTTVEQFSLRAGDAARPMKDPLVLHFDGAVPVLTDTRFNFDLDADGQTEAIPFVGQGSGVLVLDRNRNGQIDNGSELFGALSGDGFADLARLDSDRNGWIDEADPAFAQLQVWQKDSAGTDHYRSLQASGIGALSLARTSSPYSLYGASDTLLGQVRASGVYLSENGQAAVMHQIDLAA